MSDQDKCLATAERQEASAHNPLLGALIELVFKEVCGNPSVHEAQGELDDIWNRLDVPRDTLDDLWTAVYYYSARTIQEAFLLGAHGGSLADAARALAGVGK